MKPGDQVAGYRIESVLGAGGMGVVYEATQLSLNRKVALKLLPAHLRDDEVFRERFRREGEIQAAIDHPNIVTVYEAGATDEGLYFVMRLIQGSTLKDLISAGEMSTARAIRLLTPIADALDTAHAAGLTHRDIKPQNILVGPSDRPYLADFGLTRSATDAGLTRTGQFVGTIDYVSPEQIRGEQASAASDIYALTAVLYESLCGVVPYPRPSDHAILFSHLSEPPPRVTERRPELPAELDAVIARGMAKDPHERQTSGTEMVTDAERAITTGERPVTTRIAAPEAVASTPATRPAARRARAAWKIVLALAAAAAIGAAIAVAVLSGGGGGESDSDSGSTERRGDPISMRPVPDGKVVANAVLLDYGSPPPTLQLQLTPFGPRYQLLLFDELEEVRRFTSLPESAMHVLGGGAQGDLDSGSDQDPGTTGTFGPALPANFRRYRYFGIVKAEGATRELVLYDRIDRLTDPR
jgi:hypothetical protein